MTGLLSTPPRNPEPLDATVTVDGWYPPVKLSAVRDVLRIGDGVVTAPRLIAAIEGAVLHAMRELDGWRAERARAGAAKLADVTTVTVNGQNHAELLWTRIVRYFAGAELACQHRDVSATTVGLDRAAEQDDSADELRRLALAAVADLRSIGGAAVARNRVELI